MNNPSILVMIALLINTSVFAHSGGTDANGCHAGSQPYHCHSSSSSSSRNSAKPISSDSKFHLIDGSVFDGIFLDRFFTMRLRNLEERNVGVELLLFKGKHESEVAIPVSIKVSENSLITLMLREEDKSIVEYRNNKYHLILDSDRFKGGVSFDSGRWSVVSDLIMIDDVLLWDVGARYQFEDLPIFMGYKNGMFLSDHESENGIGILDFGIEKTINLSKFFLMAGVYYSRPDDTQLDDYLIFSIDAHF